MIIAVDAMGGDFAPGEIVKGAALGSKLYGVDIILVGNQPAIEDCLPNEFRRSKRISIVHAAEVIGMKEHVNAVRTKRDASVVVAASLVKSGAAAGMFTMGHSGAGMAAATLKYGRINGIDRPPLAGVFPNRFGGCTVMLDVGAVVDCSVENLKQFAILGSIYAQKALGIANPRVGILSVGGEEGKGNELIKAAYEAIKALGLNFIGNVEGNDLFSGIADVIVTDGFAGNVGLKVAEGLVENVTELGKEDLNKHPWLYVPMAQLFPFFKRLKKRLDYAEFGGAPLLGLNGVCIIGHGRSKARAVTSAVRAVKNAVETDLVGTTTKALAALSSQANTSR